MKQIALLNENNEKKRSHAKNAKKINSNDLNISSDSFLEKQKMLLDASNDTSSIGNSVVVYRNIAVSNEVSNN